MSQQLEMKFEEWMENQRLGVWVLWVGTGWLVQQQTDDGKGDKGPITFLPDPTRQIEWLDG